MRKDTKLTIVLDFFVHATTMQHRVKEVSRLRSLYVGQSALLMNTDLNQAWPTASSVTKPPCVTNAASTVSHASTAGAPSVLPQSMHAPIHAATMSVIPLNLRTIIHLLIMGY